MIILNHYWITFKWKTWCENESFKLDKHENSLACIETNDETLRDTSKKKT